MPNSYAQQAQLTCPQCGRLIEAEVWLIIDAAQRPDLLARAVQGTLYHLLCPYCGHQSQIDASLLLYRGPWDTLAFSPAQGTTVEQAQQHAGGLLGRLRQQLGATWQNGWLRQAVAVPRPALGAYLQGGRKALEQEIARLRSYQPEEDGISQDLRSLFERITRLTRLQDMPERVRVCQQALRLVSRESQPELWAALQGELGNSLAQNPLGSRADNLEQAIQAYQLALQVYTREAFPSDWASTQNNLANAYSDRIRGERADNLEQAIQAYQLALTVRTREAFPSDWAMTQNNLANAYNNRIRGERADNLEQAIQAYQLALTVRTREAFPEQWATTQNNLANAYSDRIRGERADNLEHAEDLERAIQAYQLALQVYTREAFPERWATTQNNLAATYSDRIRGERADNLEHAEDLERAIQAYQLALQVYTPEAFPIECLQTARNLGDLGFETQVWGPAGDGYAQVVRAGRVLFRQALLRPGQEAELGKLRGVSARAAYALAKYHHPEEAVEVLEEGRAQLLAEALQKKRRDLLDLPKRGPRERAISERYQNAERRLKEARDMAKGQPPGWQVQIEAAQAGEAQAIAEVQSVEGYQDFFQTLSCERIVQIAAFGALVYILYTSHGGLALVVQSGTVHEVWLPELTEKALLEQLQGSAEERESGGYLGAYNQWRTEPRAPAAFQAWKNALDQAAQWLWTAVMEKVTVDLRASYQEQAVLIPTGLLGLLPLHAAWTQDQDGRRHYALDDVNFTLAPSAAAYHAARSLAEIEPISILTIDNPDGSLRFSGEEVSAAVETFLPSACRLQGDQASLERVESEILGHPVLHFSTHGLASFDQPLASFLLLAGGQRFTLGQLLDLRLPGARLAILSACETNLQGVDLPDEVISLPAGFLQAGVGGVVGSLWSVSDASTMILMARFYENWRKKGLPPASALRCAQKWLRDSDKTDKKRYFIPHSSDPEEEITAVPTHRLPTEVADRALAELAAQQDFSHPVYWAAFQYIGV